MNSLMIGGGVTFDILDFEEGDELGSSSIDYESISTCSDREHAPRCENDFSDDEFGADNLNSERYNVVNVAKSTKKEQPVWINRYRVDSQFLPCYRYTLPGDLSDTSLARHEHFLFTSAQTTQSRQLRTLREVVSIPTLLHLLHFYIGSGPLLPWNMNIGENTQHCIVVKDYGYASCNEWTTAAVLLQVLVCLLSSVEAVHSVAPAASSDASYLTLSKQQQVKLQRKKHREENLHAQHRNIWGEHLLDLEVLIPSLISQLLTCRTLFTFSRNLRNGCNERSMSPDCNDYVENDNDDDDEAGDQCGRVLEQFDEMESTCENEDEKLCLERQSPANNINNESEEQSAVFHDVEESNSETSLLSTMVNERRKSLKEESDDEKLGANNEMPLENKNTLNSPVSTTTTKSDEKFEYECAFLPFVYTQDGPDEANDHDRDSESVDDVAAVRHILSRLHNIHQYHASFDCVMNFVATENDVGVEKRCPVTLVTSSIESLCDLLLGRPRGLRLHGPFLLLNSWDLSSSQEPMYVRYKHTPASMRHIVIDLQKIEDDMQIPDLSQEELASLHEKRASLSKLLKNEECMQDVVSGMLPSMSVSVALPLLLRSALEAALLSSPSSLHHLAKIQSNTAQGEMEVNSQLRDIPDFDETEMSDINRIRHEDATTSCSAALTVLCLIYSLLDQNIHFRKSLFNPVLPSPANPTSGENKERFSEHADKQPGLLIDLLLSYVTRIFLAAAEAKLIQILGTEIDLEEAFAAFDNGVQLPYHVVYNCCANPIGQICLQIFCLLYSSDKFRLKPSRLRDAAIAAISKGGEVTMTPRQNPSTDAPGSSAHQYGSTLRKKNSGSSGGKFSRQNSGASLNSSHSDGGSTVGESSSKLGVDEERRDSSPKMIALTDLTIGERSYLNKALLRTLHQLPLPLSSDDVSKSRARQCNISLSNKNSPSNIATHSTVFIPYLPRSIATTFLYIFNAAFRRRVIDVHFHQQVIEEDLTLWSLKSRPNTPPPRDSISPSYSKKKVPSRKSCSPTPFSQASSALQSPPLERQSISSTRTRATTTYYFQQGDAYNFIDLSAHYVTPDVRLKRKLHCRQYFPTLAPFLGEVLYFELELSSRTTGNFDTHLMSRVLEPLGQLIEIADKFRHTLNSAHGLSRKNDMDHKKSSSSMNERLNKGSGSGSWSSSLVGWGSSWLAPIAGKKGFGNAEPGNNAEKSIDVTVDTNPRTSATNSFRDRTLSTEEEAIGDITVKPLYSSRLGQLKRNVSTFVSQAFTGAASSTVTAEEIAAEEDRLALVECHEALCSVVRVMRSAAVLLLELLREKTEKRKEILLFMFHHKKYFFRPLPLKPGVIQRDVMEDNRVSDSQEDKQYTATLTFYFYQCLHDSDMELKLRALLCWGHLLCGDPASRDGSLTNDARDLLLLEVAF